jgi:hypothetical protein
MSDIRDRWRQWRLVGKLMMNFGSTNPPLSNTNILPATTFLCLQAVS